MGPIAQLVRVPVSHTGSHWFKSSWAHQWLQGVRCVGLVAQTPFRSLKRIFDHSKVRFTANLKLALWAQTLGLRPFRFTKNGYKKFFNVRSRRFRQQPVNLKSGSVGPDFFFLVNIILLWYYWPMRRLGQKIIPLFFVLLLLSIPLFSQAVDSQTAWIKRIVDGENPL